jgi:hypothetical protein
VLAVIEESLMRRAESSEQAFDLPAYRELLMLYSVATDIIGSGSDESSGAAGVAALGDAPMPLGANVVPEGDDVDIPLDFHDSGGGGARPEFRSTSIEPLQASADALVDRSPPQHLDP